MFPEPVFILTLKVTRWRNIFKQEFRKCFQWLKTHRNDYIEWKNNYLGLTNVSFSSVLVNGCSVSIIFNAPRISIYKYKNKFCYKIIDVSMDIIIRETELAHLIYLPNDHIFKSFSGVLLRCDDIKRGYRCRPSFRERGREGKDKRSLPNLLLQREDSKWSWI